jgi:Phage minor capsid protein 2.
MSDAMKLSKELLAELKDVTHALDSIIHDIAMTTDTSSKYWLQVQRDIRAQYESARKIADEWTRAALDKTYFGVMEKQLAALKNKVVKAENISFYDFVSQHGITQSFNSLLNDTLLSYRNGFKMGETTMIRLSRLTQQILLSEKAINRQIAEGYLEGGSVRSSKRKLRDALMKKALDGQMITIIDKNGKPEQWNIDTYAELVARTKIMDASSQSVLDTAHSLDQDLVAWSAHNTLCAICAPYEGRVFSISGNSEDFPPLEAVPPGDTHPNCEHSLIVIVPEALKADGTYDEFSDFSKGVTDMHPTRKGFIPVSERELH